MTAPAQSAYDRILAALTDTTGYPPRATGRQAHARCPAHDDTNPSLSITRGTDRILVKCHYGCDTDDILTALGLTRADLFDEAKQNGHKPIEIARYPYTDEHGQVLFHKIRLMPKDFLVTPPGVVGKLAHKPLYRLPEITAAIAAGQTVYVVEGEKDADALAARGQAATCNYEGAAKEGQRPKWRPEYGDQLKDADVVVVADRDQAGYAHARAILADLTGKATAVRVAQAAVDTPKADISDHLAAGHTLEQLQPVDLDATAAPSTDDPQHGDEDETTGFRYVDFIELFTKPRQPPQWLAKPLIAAGRVTLFYSPGKVGKSLIAMEAAAAIATGMPILDSQPGELLHVLYVDQEMVPEDWLDRLTDMGYTADDAKLLNERLHLAQLQAWPPMDTAMGGAAVLAEAEATCARVVVIDTASKVVRGEENSNDTHGALYRNTVVPLKRRGIAVLILDHTGKDVERGARGGSAKTDNVDLAFELLVRGHDLVSLRCTHKRFRDDALDESIFLRRESDPLRHVIHNPRLEMPAEGFEPTHLMDKISRYVEGHPGVSKNSITAAVGGKRDYVFLAIDLLITKGYLSTTPGKNRSVQHHSVHPYRQDDEI